MSAAKKSKFAALYLKKIYINSTPSPPETKDFRGEKFSFSLQFTEFLPQSRPDGYLARFCQKLAKTAYLARSGRKMVILQDLAENGYLERSARKMVILQDSCEFVPVELSSYWLSFMKDISF